jgi:hypothetical protein
MLDLDLDDDAALVVAHPSGEAQLAGEAVDVGPEADALHDALDAHADATAAGEHRHGQSGGWRRNADKTTP